jgi:hypothetical protein
MEEKKKKPPILIEAIVTAVLTFWLRTTRGASMEDIALQLNETYPRVRAALLATIPDGLPSWQKGKVTAARLPHCDRHDGGSHGGRGNGSYPTTWTPSIAYLRALVRREDGTRHHRWYVHVYIVSKVALYGSKERCYEAFAKTEEAALADVR